MAAPQSAPNKNARGIVSDARCQSIPSGRSPDRPLTAIFAANKARPVKGPNGSLMERCAASEAVGVSTRAELRFSERQLRCAFSKRTCTVAVIVEQIPRRCHTKGVGEKVDHNVRLCQV